MRGGYLQLGRFRGAPIRFHVSIPVGALVFTGFSLQPGAWVAFIALILAHELGHALICRACRLTVLGIDIHGLGGVCRYRDTATPWQRSLVAWGGVLAQALLLGAASIVHALGLVGESGFAYDLCRTFVTTNACVMALNLVPVGPLDGARAWMLIPMALGRLRVPRPRVPRLRALRRRLRRPPPGGALKLVPLPEETEDELRRALERARTKKGG